MWSRYKVRKVHQIPIVERMWQAIAQQIAAADPKPLRGFGRLSSGVMLCEPGYWRSESMTISAINAKG
nr:hypothetical protein pKpnC6_00109 [Klebsiella pneumoniae]